ncbi:TfoX domain-containing protein [Paludibacter propionicigenes WB4]|uniref:TfoX domain-containing protein n=1 Tax=Paludibacter propionicigenes (strain DSM 17365 / JCM 13257 / WB4) TaxID=694427 RepID=E4T486_PALPW|nr:TfoX/Sxy family protein [Paludibacter propionicigenes]ADQ79530.1 TfoX domain-containing protein [Paludibacter propionicigenes WB4]
MKTDLSLQPNIGKDTEAKLLEVGILNYAELQTVGTEQAFLRLQTLDPGACIHLLYGLEGAIEGIQSTKLSAEKKQQLREFHRMANK